MRLKMITEYKRDGYHAQLVKSERVSDTATGFPQYVCIYERTKEKTAPHWEVILLRGVGASTIGGKPFPARLLVPSPTDWGKRAWTYTDFDTAQEKHREVCKTRTSST